MLERPNIFILLSKDMRMKGRFSCFSKIAFVISSCCREVAIVERLNIQKKMYFVLSEKWLLF